MQADLLLPPQYKYKFYLSIVIFEQCALLYGVLDYPEVTQHPENQLNIDPGSNVSFSVTGVRSISYQWHYNSSGITHNQSKYEGTRHSTLTVFNVDHRDEGLYSCVVGSRILSVLSNTAQLSLCMYIYLNKEHVIAMWNKMWFHNS